ncbi:hypothetical protein AAY473_017071, partial [Plecturocebus cupreus]
MFQILAEILKETNTRPSFPSWCMITYLNFQKSLSITSKAQKTPKLGRNGSVTHLQICQVTRFCHLLKEFWIEVKVKYPVIATKPLKSLLPFPASYLSEAEFSLVTATKMRLRSRLDTSNTLWCPSFPSPP